MMGLLKYQDLSKWDNINPNRVSSHALQPGDTRWYIIVLGNGDCPSPAFQQVLRELPYLNRRTKEVRFFMAGFANCDWGVETSFFSSANFLDTVEWLEDNIPGYRYSEAMDMVLLPFTKKDLKFLICPLNKEMMTEETYDFSHALHYNLDELLGQHINVNQFVMRAVDVVSNYLPYEETKRVMAGDREPQEAAGHKVFIAGSKSLSAERDAIRSAFSQLSNRWGVHFRTFTYEDFERSFTEEGRQSDYDHFIMNEADTTIFILDDEVGGVTRKEFNTALDSFFRTCRPRIYVYSKAFAENKAQNTDTPYERARLQRLRDIRDDIDDANQYYTEYRDIDNLKLQISQDFSLVAADLRGTPQPSSPNHRNQRHGEQET